MKNRGLMVTIRCLVYNHEPFLRQCLDGFAMQQTNFPFEAIVHDDVSTDGSAAIIREYAEKYPDIIKPIFETENQYSKHDGSLRRIMNAHTRGKYVAYCEGDDYWTDPLKLQKQVDFLESHPDYSMCFHKAKVIDSQGNEIKFFPECSEREYFRDELLYRWMTPTASIVCRREVINRIPTNKSFTVGDNLVIITSSYLGRIFCINREMSVYRRSETSWSSQSELKKHALILQHFKAIKESFPADIRYCADNIILSKYDMIKKILKQEGKYVRLIVVTLSAAKHTLFFYGGLYVGKVIEKLKKSNFLCRK